MRRRRFFRVLTLTLLLLCLGAWVWSLISVGFLEYRQPYRFTGIKMDRGVVVILDRQWTMGSELGLRCHHLWQGSSNEGNPVAQITQILFQMGEAEVGPSEHQFGFALRRDGSKQLVRFPLWFPTLLLTALTAWAWRKRRREGNRGFAVELGRGEG